MIQTIAKLLIEHGYRRTFVLSHVFSKHADNFYSEVYAYNNYLNIYINHVNNVNEIEIKINYAKEKNRTIYYNDPNLMNFIKNPSMLFDE